MSDDSALTRMLRVFYVDLYKPTQKLLAFLFAGVGIALTRLLWPDAVGYVYGAVGLAMVPLAFLAFEASGRALGVLHHQPFDWGNRAFWLGVIGMGLAFTLCVFLAIGETRDRAASQAARAAGDAFTESMRTANVSADVERANALIERLHNAGTRPAP